MYKIIGADGKAYGPVSEQEIRLWISQSRVNAQTQVQAEGTQEWKPLGAFPEFADLLAPAVAPIAPSLPGVAAANQRGTAEKAVNAPALALKIHAILLAVGTLLGFALAFAIGRGIDIIPGIPEDVKAQMVKNFSLVQTILSTLLNLAFVGLIFVGASKLKELKSYGLVMTAAILAMLPCSFCCIIGLPIGIWVLVVMNQPDVKSQFN